MRFNINAIERLDSLPLYSSSILRGIKGTLVIVDWIENGESNGISLAICIYGHRNRLLADD